MSEKKNIDRLFQEKFKDFEANPAEDLWSGIEARLNEKKRKRVIPLWWKLSGVAAVFLIGLLVTQTVSNHDIAPTNPVVIEENANPNNGKSTVVGSEKEGTNGVTPNSDTNVKPENAPNNSVSPQFESNVNVVADKSTSGDNKPSTNGQKSNRKVNPSAVVNDSKSSIAQSKSNEHSSSKNELNSKEKNSSTNGEILEKNQNDALAISKDKENQSNVDKSLAQTNR